MPLLLLLLRVPRWVWALIFSLLFAVPVLVLPREHPPAAPAPTPTATATPALPAPPCLDQHGAPQLAPLTALVRPARYIVLHHWGAPPPSSITAMQGIFASMRYNGPPYNAMITRAGVLWQGRPESRESGATWGLNDRSVAVCLVDDLTTRTATDAAVGAAGVWVRGALRRHPRALFVQHRDAGRMYGYGTSCAGEATQRDRTARAVWLVACGYQVPEARRRARAGL